MCLIDFGMPVEQNEENELINIQGSALKKLANGHISKRLKRKLRNYQTETKPTANSKKNFEFFAFKDPVLYIGHLSKSSMLIVDKSWMEVVKTFDAPLHRHIFGT